MFHATGRAASPTSATSANFHSLTPTTKNIAAPETVSISAVPRSGWRKTRNAGAKIISNGTASRLGRPISSVETP